MGADGLIQEPATCLLKLGDLLTSRVIMKDAPGVSYAGPWEPDRVLPYHASVDCTFTEVNRVPKDADGVLNNIPAYVYASSVMQGVQRAMNVGMGAFRSVGL